MAMVMPLEGTISEEAGGDGTEPPRLPFIEMAEWLGGRELPVPTLFHYEAAQNVLLLEDLGDLTLEKALDETNRAGLYQRALNLLLEFQSKTQAPEPDLVACQRAMSREVLAWELEHYVEWRLLADLQRAPGPWQEALTSAFQPLLDALVALPQRLIHRDFQSRNLMLEPDGELVLIDFQDALLGPYIYDLVALLRDSYVVLSVPELDALLTAYAEGALAAGLIEATSAEVARAFHLQTVQRKLKDCGRFVYIDRVKGNPSFLPYRHPSMSYVWHALGQLPELQTLRDLLSELDPL